MIDVKLTDEEWAVYEGSSVHVGAHEVMTHTERERGDLADGQDWRSSVATPTTEDAWLAEVRGRTMREIEHALAGRAEGDHPDDPVDPDLEPRRLPLELTPEAYALWLEVRRRLETDVGERLDDSAVITAMARRALEPAGASSTPVTAAAPATSRPPYQLAITLCPRCDRATQAAAGDVVDVRPETVEQACCDGVHLGRVDGERPDVPTLTIPLRTRTAVLARDQHRCTVPGCRSTRGLELHHIQWRSRGGDHRARNLTTTCSHHHAAVHHGHLRVTGEAPHALRFERAGDTPYATDVVAEVRAALRGLGFRPADITRAVEQASAHVDADAPLDVWLRASLRACPRPASSSPG